MIRRHLLAMPRCPARRSFSEDQWEMEPQLSGAWPVHTYPHLILLPDGTVAMSAGSSLVSVLAGRRLPVHMAASRLHARCGQLHTRGP